MELLWNENFPNFGYPSEGSALYWKFKQNAFSFAARNVRKFRSVDKFSSNGKHRRLTECNL